MKAKFMVTIVHDDKSKVFFNMPLKTQSEVRGQANTVSLKYRQEHFSSRQKFYHILLINDFGEKKLNPLEKSLTPNCLDK